MTQVLTQNKLMMAVMGLIVAAGLLLPGLFANAPLAMAQPTGAGDAAQQGLGDIGGAYPGGAKQNVRVADIAKKVIDWALYIAAIIAVVFVIIGGFMYITSAGNADQAGKGRRTLVNALIGLAIIVLSYLIVQIVYNFLIGR